MTADRIIGIVAVIAGSVAAAFALIVDGEAELALYMAAALVGSLACFDAALNRRNRSFVPWLLLSAAVLAKAIPSVLGDISEGDVSSFERLDHIGTAAAAVLVALALLFAVRGEGWVRRVILTGLAGLAAALAGATLGFVEDTRFSSRTLARLLETVSWAAVAAVLVGLALWIWSRRSLTVSMVVAGIGAAAVATLTAFAAAGRSLDIGWWAIVWVVFAAGATLFRPAAIGGTASSGWRRPLAFVGLVVAALCLVLAVWSFVGDGGSLIAGLLLAGAGIAAAALTGSGLFTSVGDRVDTGIGDLAHDGPEGDLLGEPAQPAVFEESPPAAPVSIESTVAGPLVEPPLGEWPADQPLVESPLVESPLVESSAAEPFVEPPLVEPLVEPPLVESGIATPQIVAPQIVAPEIVAPQVAAAETTEALSPSAAPPPYPEQIDQPAAAAVASSISNPTPAPSTSAGVDASRARMLRGLQRQHFDPGTRLLSAAGLEQVLRTEVGDGRGSGEVALLLLAVRNFDLIEQTHGRLAVDRVCREIADRLHSSLPEAAAARFARSAFALVLTDQLPPAAAVIERCTHALVAVLADVVHEGNRIQIDVVAGMAQCYAGEPVANLAARANEGLERASTSVEPTLVAMP